MHESTVIRVPFGVAPFAYAVPSTGGAKEKVEVEFGRDLLHKGEPASHIVECDLLVIGSGAGGLSAAVTAAKLGLKVIVVEKDPEFGGTTAWSGGWMWVPRNALAKAAGIDEDVCAPMNYLRHELGDRFDAARALTYLRHAPEMVEFFRTQTALQFVDGNVMPDMHGKTPGAATGGRSVCAAPFDGRRLGKRIKQLKPPLDVMTLWGMNIASGADMRHFYNGMYAFSSFIHVCRRLLRHGMDRMLYGRGMHLVNGNALVAALAVSAIEAGVDIRVSSPAVRLLTDRSGTNIHATTATRVTGAVVAGEGGVVCEIRAARGVVLACGGFPHDVVRKAALLPHAPDGTTHWSAASRGNTGDGLRFAESVGATVSNDLAAAAAMAPVSVVPVANGQTRHFAHLLERGKPGLIAVTRTGHRFTNEADPYHDFMRDLIAACPEGEPVAAWLVVDHRFIRRYGLGAVKPAPMPMHRFVKNGYLQRASTIEGLALACGIDRTALLQTIHAYNSQARAGTDEAFGKGETPYNRMQGDGGNVLPNPCMAPLEHGPFYAVRVVPGSLGTFAGLRTTLGGQVIGKAGVVIDGLYANGNDMSSMMGGFYPSGGITLGPAMTFGYLLAHHAASKHDDFQWNLFLGDTTMYYELRTYTIAPTKLADWLTLYKREALAVQQEHLGQLVGFFTTEFGTVNQVVHIWAYTGLDDRADRRTKMMADPRWHEFSRLNKELGAVLVLESRMMRPTDFSPLK